MRRNLNEEATCAMERVRETTKQCDCGCTGKRIGFIDYDCEYIEYDSCPCCRDVGGKTTDSGPGGLSIEMNEQIERIVREQAMMLGFGNTGGPGIGFSTAIATPTSKYEQYEEDEDETELDEQGGGTYNVNINNQSADSNYTADGMGIFENILRNNIRSYR